MRPKATILCFFRCPRGEDYAAAALAMLSFWYPSQQLLEGFALHCGNAAIVVKQNFVAAKLTGDEPPAAAENLKLLLGFDAEADSEAFYHSERVVYASN
jgi:hypothetical protein